MDNNKNKSSFDRIIKLKIDKIAKGNLGRIESALEGRNKEKINPIRFKIYGDPDLRSQRKKRDSMDEKIEGELNKTDIHAILG